MASISLVVQFGFSTSRMREMFAFVRYVAFRRWTPPPMKEARLLPVIRGLASSSDPRCAASGDEMTPVFDGVDTSLLLECRGK